MGAERPRVPITPATTVAALLEAYPDLEPVLISLAPPFRRLKNPVLRRTVARVTTLERAAGVAGMDVRALVRHLRGAAGLDVGEGEDQGREGPADAPSTEAPPWAVDRPIAAEIDADRTLARSETPLAVVLAAARDLEDAAVLRVLASFPPVPLAETLAARGYEPALQALATGGFCLWVRRGEGGGPHRAGGSEGRAS